MARRSTTSGQDADRKFPIRVKLRVPSTGLGTMIVDMDVWLKLSFSSDGYGQGPAFATGMDAMAFHFMTIEDAQAFLKAFPSAELATDLMNPKPLPNGY